MDEKCGGCGLPESLHIERYQGHRSDLSDEVCMIAAQARILELEKELDAAVEEAGVYRKYWEADLYHRTLPPDMPGYNAAVDVTRAEAAIEKYRSEGG